MKRALMYPALFGALQRRNGASFSLHLTCLSAHLQCHELNHIKTETSWLALKILNRLRALKQKEAIAKPNWLISDGLSIMPLLASLIFHRKVKRLPKSFLV